MENIVLLLYIYGKITKIYETVTYKCFGAQEVDIFFWNNILNLKRELRASHAKKLLFFERDGHTHIHTYTHTHTYTQG